MEQTEKKKEQSEETYYKNRYHIVFYGEDDETYVAGFNTVADICRYQHKKITPGNIRYLHVLIYNALKRDNHQTRMLDGTPMHIYLIDMKDED